MTIITTSRLRLEPINDEHFDGFYALNSDPAVMRYITGKADTREDTSAMIQRVKLRWTEFGFSWWSFLERDSNEIIGAGCIQHLGRDRENPLEIGWRLRRDKWGLGFASEAAQAMAMFAFATLGAETLTAVCHPENHNSSRVMTRLGMELRGQEVWCEMDTLVYEMTRDQWRASQDGDGKIQLNIMR